MRVEVAELGVEESGGQWGSWKARLVAGHVCGWASVMPVLVALVGCCGESGKGGSGWRGWRGLAGNPHGEARWLALVGQSHGATRGGLASELWLPAEAASGRGRVFGFRASSSLCVSRSVGLICQGQGPLSLRVRRRDPEPLVFGEVFSA